MKSTINGKESYILVPDTHGMSKEYRKGLGEADILVNHKEYSYTSFLSISFHPNPERSPLTGSMFSKGTLHSSESRSERIIFRTKPLIDSED